MEVTPLRSKHHSLQTGEVGDLVDLLGAFELQNTVRVRWILELPTPTIRLDLVVRVEAWPFEWGEQGAKPLASASVTCLATGLRDLASVLIHALYLLDGQLAALEWERKEQSS